MENKSGFLDAVKAGVKLGFSRREIFKTLGWCVPSLLLAVSLGFDLGWKVWLLIFFAVTLACTVEKVWPEERGS